MVKYKPSEVNILVHAGKPTTTSATPDEIGTPTTPEDEGVVISIDALLSDNLGNPIPTKTLHLYDPDGVELSVKVTDVIGLATFDYTVDALHDGRNLTIKYLGD